ncbi:unnamed protein product [Diamesa serratosioi]
MPIESVYFTRVRAEDCGQEELVRCSKPLQMLQSTTDLSFTPRREELDKLCPDLKAGLNCIRSYTRRCMTFKQREQFMQIYKGTDEVIRDLCKEGAYQDEFLKHSPCLQTVKPQHEKCGIAYQDTMSSIFKAKANQTEQQQQQPSNANEDVKNVCCSFRDYLDCSEHVTRRACGAETGHFIRGFLNKMSSSLEKNYCEEYYKGGNNQCPNIFSSAISHFSTSSIVKTLLPMLLLAINFLR